MGNVSVLMRGAFAAISALCMIASDADASAAPTAAPIAARTTRVSVDSSGAQSNDASYSASISLGGRYVAYYSYASNLVPHDTNHAADVFVRDRKKQVTSLVSLGAQGAQGNGSSETAAQAISANGRYIAITSDASNLVDGDTNNYRDVYLRDRATGMTWRVSVSSAGEQADGSCNFPVISSDGRYVAYTSDASSLVPGDTNNSGDVFLWDRRSGETRRVSVDSTGSQSNGYSYYPAISADGRYVAFNSEASNLVAQDNNGRRDIFVYDRITRATRRVSTRSDGTEANGDSGLIPAISPGGRFVAFQSEASNLVPRDTNYEPDIFVHDRLSNHTSRVSVGRGGGQANALSDRPAISRRGRYVAFYSFSSNLVEGDTNNQPDIFIRDRDAEVTRRISLGRRGAQPDGESFSPAISARGRYLAYESGAKNLVPGDTNNVGDVFVFSRP